MVRQAIARATGLSNKTVGSIRQANHSVARLSQRVGQDGRVRPINSAIRRQHASELLARQPGTSVCEIAAVAGLSATTVRDVRDRLRRGQNPIPAPRPGSRAADAFRSGSACSNDAEVDINAVLDNLSKDPALRYSGVGRLLLHWLRAHSPVAQSDKVVAALPTHCLPAIARLTRRYALFWNDLAEMVENARTIRISDMSTADNEAARRVQPSAEPRLPRGWRR